MLKSVSILTSRWGIHYVNNYAIITWNCWLGLQWISQTLILGKCYYLQEALILSALTVGAVFRNDLKFLTHSGSTYWWGLFNLRTLRYSCSNMVVMVELIINTRFVSYVSAQMWTKFKKCHVKSFTGKS